MKEYQYILTYGTTVEILGFNPAGWDKLGITWMRHEVYHSVLRSFTLSLRFVNINRGGLTGGYQLIKQAYDTDGVYAEVSIEIKKRNPDTNDYDSLYTGVLDFTPGRWTIDRDLFWEISINDSSVLQKFISRDENEINILSNKTIDNTTITALATEFVNFTPVDIVVKYKAICVFEGANGDTPTGVAIPIVYSGSSLIPSEPTVTLNQIERVTIGGLYGNWETSVFKTIYTNDQTDTKRFQFKADVTYDSSIRIVSDNSGTYSLKLYVKHYNELDGLVQSQNFLIVSGAYTSGTHTYTPSGSVSGYLNVANVATGHYIDAYYVIETTTTIVQILLTPGTSCDLELLETTFGKASTRVYGNYAFDTFNKSLQILTGVANSLDSSVMEAGGELEHDFITNGYQIRKYPGPKMSLTFRELFKSFDGISNLGLWYDKINNKFIIEKKYTFFDNATKLFDANSISKFKIQPYTNAYYNKITAGFDNVGSYERVQGAVEFAVKREYATSAKVKEEKSIQVPYRFDSVMIEELRNLQYVNSATEDNDADNNVFIVRTDGNEPIMPDLGSPEYLGMDVFYSYYNTMLTPRQNAVRWGNIIRACAYHNSNPIQAQKTEKQFELVVDGIDENSNITVLELGDAMYIPELYTFESYLTPDNIQTLLTNPHGYIDFIYNNVQYSGFINKIELTDNNRKANFELIARDNTVYLRTFEDNNLHIFTDDDQKING